MRMLMMGALSALTRVAGYLGLFFVVSGVAHAATVGQITHFPLSSEVSLGQIVGGPDGNVWFNASNPQPGIGRITETGQVTIFPTNTGGLPPDIALGPDGNLWFTNNPSTWAYIGRITPTGQITQFSTGLQPQSVPGAITAGPDGNMWFTDASSYTALEIGQITPTGHITEFPTGLIAGYDILGGLVAGPDGNLWFTVYEGGEAGVEFGRMTTTGVVTYFKTNIEPGDVDWITAGPGGVWFALSGANAGVGRITPSGRVTVFSTRMPANFPSYPQEIVEGPDGNMWFTDVDRQAIGRVTPAGQITEYGLTYNGYPQAIAVGPDGNLWFTDGGSFRTNPPDQTAIGRAQLIAEPQLTLPQPPQLQVSSVAMAAAGTTRFTVHVSAPGEIDVLETAWLDNFSKGYGPPAASSAEVLLQPAPGRFVFARSHSFTAQAGALPITVAPDSQGSVLVYHHRYRVTIRVWVTYSPSDGRRQTVGFYALLAGGACPSVTVDTGGRFKAHCSSRA
jgi:streptogramin lyase